jgi:tripartite-type tricarboxylate transporter receptor subunit TctC
MRTILRAGLALGLTMAASAFAADWPAKQVKLIVPSGAGSSPDIFARLLAASMQQRLGQTFIVENKGGASGALGMDQVVKSPADGYTLGVAYPAPLTTNNLMMKKMPYDSRKDVQLITNAVLQPTVLVVGNHLDVKNFNDLAALLKKAPGKYNSASTGASSLGRLLAEALAHQLGTSIQNVVYNGAAPTMIALVRGDVDFAFLPAAGAMSFITSEKVKLVALAAERRSALLPNVPTLKELGVAGIDGSNWLGIIAPAGVTTDTAARIRQGVIASLNSPELKKSLADNYMELVGSTAAEFATTVDEDTRRWKPLIEKLAISID